MEGRYGRLFSLSLGVLLPRSHSTPGTHWSSFHPLGAIVSEVRLEAESQMFDEFFSLGKSTVFGLLSGRFAITLAARSCEQ